MNAPASASRFNLADADRFGVTASVLRAIHCALAPVLLIFLPTFGRIWAHSASHALVAIFIVPVAYFTVRKGYKVHKKLWVLSSASIGVFLVIIGAFLPAFTKAENTIVPDNQAAPIVVDSSQAKSESEEYFTCDSCSSEEETTQEASCSTCASASASEATGCVDNCCPSIQMTDIGEMKLHIPPAAIVTTLGGIFLITAHAGNLCNGGYKCATEECKFC